ncbi:MAG: Holliday junction branch migration protein RuvA [Clostridia bacterium]|nr:Holliday junction branch migration protein RuvA [Clostridia bacterium]
MYAYIRGTVAEITQDSAVIDAMGVGYELFCSANTRKTLVLGEQAKLLTHFYQTQDVNALYGFATAEERVMFRKLLSVNRVGPKLALSVLSTLLPTDIAGAVYTQNAAAFDKIPGMGRKTAARVLLELKEKIDSDDMIASPVAGKADAGKMDMRTEAVAALVALGYDGVQAGRAVGAVQEECARVEDMITLALREMVKRSGK